MEQKTPLTIDATATKAKLKADGHKVAAYARARGVTPTSMSEILRGAYYLRLGSDQANVRKLFS